ncbi:MAG: serine/threonine-protein kinase [Bacteroidota bacterium]
MTNDQWARLATLVPDALDLMPEERRPFLQRECRLSTGELDAELLRQAEALIASSIEATEAGAFRSPVGGLAGQLAADEGITRHAPPETVGPWRVTGVLGEGGQGVVYRAIRADGAFERSVALKLIRPGVGDKLVARLAEERRVLARLEHEGVARLYDGGITNDGRPYLAMELVDGHTITDFATSTQLSTRERVAMLVSVCQAVAYAHQRLIIHRDLKPSNVLVTQDGQPKLLDFGVAKLLDEAHDPTLTVPGWMTPAYAAPEQVRQGEITTATDVYALGVLAYELLAGRRPYTTTGLSPAETERIVCEVAPPLASATAAEAVPGRAATLRGDLDVILAKALAKDPDRRYASAEALGADLQRHLDELPVEARPATAAYRVSRFVRRHRAATTAAVIAVVAIVTGAGAALWQAAEATQQRIRAEQEALTAETTASFLANLFQGAEPATALGDTLTAFDLLERGVARADSELAETPLIHGRVLYAVGRAYYHLADYIGADSTLARAIAILDPLRDEATQAYAAALTMHGSTLSYRADWARATPILERAVDALAAAGDTTSLDYLKALMQTGTSLSRERRLEDATIYLEQAVRVARSIFAATGDDDTSIPATFNAYGYLLQQLDRLDEAEVMYREALAMVDASVGERHPDWVTGTSNLANFLNQSGRHAEAETAARRALALAPEVYGEQHPGTAFVQLNLGESLRGQARYAEAEALYRDALALGRPSLGENHPAITVALTGLGESLRQTARTEEALPVLRQAMAVTSTAAPGNAYGDRARIELARALVALGNPSEAQALLEVGIQRIEDYGRPTPITSEDLRTVLRELGLAE